MSLRLKSHSESCPNGFLYQQTQTGWKSWEHAPISRWDWNALVSAVQQHRQANPKFGLPTDTAAIERELDYVNALRVNAMRGGHIYVTDDERPPPPKSLASRLSQLASVAAGVGKVRAGALTLLDWNLSENPPVAPELAFGRANVCVKCPLNGQGDLTRWFTVPIAEQIRRAMERRFEMKLETPNDSKLGVCDACTCPLTLKVWCPIDFIQQRMPADVKNDLDPGCWILKEMA